MRIIICDDDEHIRSELKEIICTYFTNASLRQPEYGIFDCGNELLADTGEKDIVFLEIALPDINGISVGEILKKQNPKVIILIITSYIGFLDDAMRIQVFRYLTKPLDRERIFINMNDALKLYNTVSRSIPIETKHGVFTIPISDIVSVEVLIHCVTIHTVNKDYSCTQSIQYWRKKLNYPCFFSPHRSYIVNLSHVNRFDHSLIYLYDDQFTAYLTRRKYSEFKEAYSLYLECVQYTISK